VGLSYALSKKSTVDVGYSRLFIADGKMNLSAAGDNQLRGSLTGTIQAEINLFGAGFRYSF